MPERWLVDCLVCAQAFNSEQVACVSSRRPIRSERLPRRNKHNPTELASLLHQFPNRIVELPTLPSTSNTRTARHFLSPPSDNKPKQTPTRASICGHRKSSHRQPNSTNENRADPECLFRSRAVTPPQQANPAQNVCITDRPSMPLTFPSDPDQKGDHPRCKSTARRLFVDPERHIVLHHTRR